MSASRHPTFEPSKTGLQALRTEDCPRCLRTVALVKVGEMHYHMAIASDPLGFVPTDYMHACGPTAEDGYRPEHRIPLRGEAK